jgi:hypothetical protein
MKWSLLPAQLLLCSMAMAGQAEAIPGCYNKALPAAGVPLETELFVAIDQTTPLDVSLKQLVADNIKPFLVANTGFSIVTFSAFTQGHYTQVLVSGKLDALLAPDKRNDVSKPLLAKFDQCTLGQPQHAARLVGNALRTAYAGSSADISKSDVLASLKAIGTLVQASKANNKVVLLVSDMLENSSISSFYADQGRSVRRLDPAKELRAVEEQQQLADFAGARFYVIGAGLLPGDQSKAKSYRDPKTMQALAAFWSAYLGKSKAQLLEFGQPALLKPVH